MARHLPIVLSDRLYVPRSLVREDTLSKYTHHIKHDVYKPVEGDRRCKNCNWWKRAWKDKHGQVQYCHKIGYSEFDLCEDFEYRKIKIVEETEIHTYKAKANGYIAFARGNLDKIQEVFGDYEIDDQRSYKKLGFKLDFGGKDNIELRPDQKSLVKQWFRAGGGVIKSPTGSGKSTMLAYAICKLGRKTLILSHEIRHLTTVLAELHNHTNLLKLEKKFGRQLCGFFSTKGGKKGTTYPITLATYQSFNGKRGKKIRKRIKQEFGFVWVEEVHHAAAETWYKAFNVFNPAWRGGGTATPTRKDKLHCVIYDSVGPIVAVGRKEMMPCEVTWVDTGIHVPDKALRGMYKWSMMLNWLGRNSRLYEIVLENVLDDIKAGYKPLILSERVYFAVKLNQDLNAMGYNSILLKGGDRKVSKSNTSDPWAPIIRKLNRGTLHAIVGTKVLDENVNIPPLDCLHLPFPSANEEREEQRAGRIRRVEEGKKTPQIRSYLFDGADIAVHGSTKVRDKVYRRLNFAYLEDASRAHSSKNRHMIVDRNLL